MVMTAQLLLRFASMCRSQVCAGLHPRDLRLLFTHYQGQAAALCNTSARAKSINSFANPEITGFPERLCNEAPEERWKKDGRETPEQTEMYGTDGNIYENLTEILEVFVFFVNFRMLGTFASVPLSLLPPGRRIAGRFRSLPFFSCSGCVSRIIVCRVRPPDGRFLICPMQATPGS